MCFDLRILPEKSADEIQRLVKEGVQAISARYPSLNITSSLERMNPGLHLPEGSEFLSLCEEVQRSGGIGAGRGTSSTSTEAALYAQAGFSALAFGPGPSQANSGGPNEYNVLEQMEQSIRFYEKLIEKVCV